MARQRTDSAFFAPANQDFLGLVGNELQIAVARRANLAYLAQQYRRAGVGHVRIALDWEAISPQPGRFDWGYSDLRVSAIANAGLRTLGILGNTPVWASSCPDLIGPDGVPLYSICIAADLEHYREYVRQTVRRYGAAGTGQIRDWEIRVESNPVNSEPGAYGVEDYVAEVNAAFEVIRAEDPGALVWAGEFAFGRFNFDRGIDWTSHVGEHADFDLHSIHHFNSAAQVASITQAVRQRLDAIGRDDAPLAITAMNLFVADLENYTEEMQAANLKSLYLSAHDAGADFAMWFAGTQWPDLADKKAGIFRYAFDVADTVVPRLAYGALEQLGQQLPEPPPPAVPYACMGVTSNPCVPVGAEARVGLYFYTTGQSAPYVQLREGPQVISCGLTNRAGERSITVPRGASRTLTLFAASSCLGAAQGGPLAQVRVTALP